MSEEFITKKGLIKLKEELAELKSVRRPEIAVRLREALEFGDIAENSEYAEAKDEQAFIEGRIAEVENVLRNISLIKPSSVKSSPVVAIGSSVAISAGSRTQKFFLVGKNEGNPARGEIAFDSPIGKAVLGRKVGDRVNVSTPSGNKKYKILNIA